MGEDAGRSRMGANRDGGGSVVAQGVDLWSLMRERDWRWGSVSRGARWTSAFNQNKCPGPPLVVVMMMLVALVNRPVRQTLLLQTTATGGKTNSRGSEWARSGSQSPACATGLAH